MKKIRNLKKKKKENYYENNNLKKQKQPHKIENRAFTMYRRNFSSESLLPPHSCSPELVKTEVVKTELVKTDFNQFKPSRIQHKAEPTNNN
jgi:hypothetical protein